MVDEIRVVDDPATVKLLTDETRRAILELLRVHNLSVRQMAEVLEKDQSTVYRHVDKLLKGGIIEQTGVRKEHHIPEKVYGRTARIFFLAPGLDDAHDRDALLKRLDESSSAVAAVLGELGFPGDQETLRDLYLEIEKVVSERLKEVKPDASLNFYTFWRLQTALVLLEMRGNSKLKSKVDRFCESFTA
jgi:DNA-binding transcriptional ArsR family regulator